MTESYVDISYPEILRYSPDPNAVKCRFLYSPDTKYSIILNYADTLALKSTAANGEGLYYPELIRSHIHTRTVYGQPRNFQLLDASGVLRTDIAVRNDVVVIFNGATEVEGVQLVLYDEGAVIYRATNLLNNTIIFS